MFLPFLSPIVFGKAFLALVFDPDRTDQIFRLAEAGINCRDRRGTSAVLERAMGDSDFARCYRERYVPPRPDLGALALLASGTLGREFASQMARSGLDPDFYEPIEPRDEIRYLELRLRQTHDLWHLLTGFDTDVKGELGLQGFMLAQTGSGISATILAAGLLHFVIRDPARLAEVMDTIIEGYLRGRRAGFLLGIRFEDLWSTPLTEVRALAGLEPAA